MDDSKLNARYSGEAAESYDAIRQQRPRWLAEQASFARFFAQVSPSSVLDCPFGTGRWLDHYVGLPGPILAVDISEDMLNKARQKIEGDGALNITFIRASALERDFLKHVPPALDLLVCTRFFNWFAAPDVSKAMANLSAAKARFAIIGVSLRPQDKGWLATSLMKLRHAMENAGRRLKSQALQHVHDENFILEEFRKNGWTVRGRDKIFTSRTRENYFWLLERV
jgi:SAM-dependent methyltransferase